MKPYNKEFVFQEIKKYNNLINEGTCGEYKIVKSNINDQSTPTYMYENKEKYNIDITKLYKGDTCIRELTVKEIESSYGAISFARGKVGIVGLGLGYLVQEIAKKTNVEEVIVYEISEETVSLYNRHFNNNNKIKIIKGDPFKAQKNTFDFFYVDTHREQLIPNIVEDYIAFNKFHEIEDYAFWGLEHFMLSCKYEDIVWVYIPENWIDMSKKAYEALEASRYIETYKPLEEESVKAILLKFKEILNA